MSDDVSDLQEEIKKRGFQWTAQRSIFNSMPYEERIRYLGILEDNELYFNSFPLCSEPPSNKDKMLHPSSSIKNQGPCRSCWAFASIASMETLALKNGYPENYLDLSEQFMVDWCNINTANYYCFDPGDCAYGGTITQSAKFIMNCGIPEEWCRKYEGIDYRPEDCDNYICCTKLSCINEDFFEKNFKVGYVCYAVNQH
jgi:hypothetical protein